MEYNKFIPMNLEADETQVLTTFLLNAKSKGGGTKIVKYSGEITVCNTNEDGEGDPKSIDDIFFFRHPKTPITQNQPVIYGVSGNNLYYFNGGQWILVPAEGLESGTHPIFAGWATENCQHFIFMGQEVRILGGQTGHSATYKLIDRRITDKNGFFKDKEEHVGLCLFPEKIPVLRVEYDMALAVRIANIHDSNLRPASYTNFLSYNAVLGIMGLYVTDDGQQQIPEEASTSLTFDSTSAVIADNYSRYVEYSIVLDYSTMDKRIRYIDIYVSAGQTVEGSVEYAYIPGSMNQRDPNNVRGGSVSLARSTGESDWSKMNWRFRQRLDVNADNILMSAAMRGCRLSGTGGAGYGMTYLGQSDAQAFPNGSLTAAGCHLRFRVSAEAEWTDASITSDGWYYGEDDQQYEAITIDKLTFVDTWYMAEIYSAWTNTEGEKWTIKGLWCHDGHTANTNRNIGSGITPPPQTQLLEMIDTAQPYALNNEYHPQAKYSAVQDLRSFRLALSLKDITDIYENMVLWSEVNRHSTFPMQNSILLQTAKGELAMGMYSVQNGVLALFEASGHLLRMTTEPVRYDEEEGRFFTSCVCHKGIVDYNNMLFWLGLNGISAFTGNGAKDISMGSIRSVYLELLANEFAVHNSYNFISSGYDVKENIVFWHFPNSTYTINTIQINTLVYSFEDSGFAFVNVGSLGSSVSGITVDLSGRAHSYISDTGYIYKLFEGGSSTSTSVLRWDSGIINPPGQMVFIRKVSLIYKGTPTITIQSKAGTVGFTYTCPENSILDSHDIFCNYVGISAKIVISFTDSVGIDELAKVEIDSVPMQMR